MMRHRFIFGPATLALCSAATHADSTTMISGDLDSVGAGGSPPKGSSDDHVTMTSDDKMIGGTGDGILAIGEGARDIGDSGDGTTGDPLQRDEVPIGTFMSDDNPILGERLMPTDPLLETERIAA